MTGESQGHFAPDPAVSVTSDYITGDRARLRAAARRSRRQPVQSCARLGLDTDLVSMRGSGEIRHDHARSDAASQGLAEVEPRARHPHLCVLLRAQQRRDHRRRLARSGARRCERRARSPWRSSSAATARRCRPTATPTAARSASRCCASWASISRSCSRWSTSRRWRSRPGARTCASPTSKSASASCRCRRSSRTARSSARPAIAISSPGRTRRCRPASSRTSCATPSCRKSSAPRSPAGCRSPMPTSPPSTGAATRR